MSVTTQPLEPPHGCTWRRFLEAHAAAHGGWTALTDLLIHRARGLVELPEDPQSIERGLRRLAGRGNAPGGQYGRWALRFLGVPTPLMQTARWMGQYHSRFSDLPASMCEAQLWLWDRPPICESRAAPWIHLGLASVAMRRGREDGARARLARALPLVDEDEQARVEALLLAARLASAGPLGDVLPDPLRELSRAELLARVEALLDALAPGPARACYEARWLDQRAYAALHPPGGAPLDEARLRGARQLYAAIASGTGIAFVEFRRSHGLAYCAWRLGELERARALARAACEHAGDGGLIRFRAMALRLLARLSADDEAARLRERADRLARQIEHEDLLDGT
ncbi:MAG: hypothetical protein H6713_13605 [Myxococcales bacterium]|nr:hypothetical protein [Myxococcales bacterium]